MGGALFKYVLKYGGENKQIWFGKIIKLICVLHSQLKLRKIRGIEKEFFFFLIKLFITILSLAKP